jgi:hypothetical protein
VQLNSTLHHSQVTFLVQDHIVAHSAAAALSLTWIASSSRLAETAKKRPATAEMAGQVRRAETAECSTAPGSDQLYRPKTSFAAIKPGSPAQVRILMRCIHNLNFSASQFQLSFISHNLRHCFSQQVAGELSTHCSCTHLCGPAMPLRHSTATCCLWPDLENQTTPRFHLQKSQLGPPSRLKHRLCRLLSLLLKGGMYYMTRLWTMCIFILLGLSVESAGDARAASILQRVRLLVLALHVGRLQCYVNTLTCSIITAQVLRVLQPCSVFWQSSSS